MATEPPSRQSVLRARMRGTPGDVWKWLSLGLGCPVRGHPKLLFPKPRPPYRTARNYDDVYNKYRASGDMPVRTLLQLARYIIIHSRRRGGYMSAKVYTAIGDSLLGIWSAIFVFGRLATPAHGVTDRDRSPVICAHSGHVSTYYRDLPVRDRSVGL